MAVPGFFLLHRTTNAWMVIAKDETIAANLAMDLREEIWSVGFRDPDSNARFGIEEDERNQPRLTFDDVDDYDGLAEYPPKDPLGETMTGFERYRRTVRVQSVGFTSDQSMASAGPGSSARMVTIEVFKIDDPAALTGFPPLVRLAFLVTAPGA